jgi:hypothetical protein
MTDRIQKLINEKLGELPEDVLTTQDMKVIERLYFPEIICEALDYAHWIDYNFYFALLKQEQSRRELLASLIDTRYYGWIQFKNISCDYRAFLELKGYKNQIKLIEKSLDMKWSEIVDYLEK